MMSETPHKAPLEPIFTQRILDAVRGLRRTETGNVVYEYIRSLLRHFEDGIQGKEREYLAILDRLLKALADTRPHGSAEQLRLRLAAMDLEPPLSRAELAALHIWLDTGLGAAQPPEAEALPGLTEQTLAPVIEALTETGAGTPPPARAPGPTEPGTEPAPPTGPSSPGGMRVDAAYRRHLDEKRNKIQEIQTALVEQIVDVIRQNEEFGVLLEMQLEAMRHAGSIEELRALRQTLINEVDKLLKGHHVLAKKLDSTYGYLQMTMSDSQLLNEELTRVHLLSLTDELTDLPNRRAFLRRLEDEVARVQRYGYPLSLALMDLDGFKSINDRYGHAAGDEVLRAFSSHVLSVFRHHDMVSRYGGEEFAVILPNTDNAGALRALRKVQRRAAETTYRHDNQTMPLPTFSAGLALYKPGETPTNLIERADKALYRAKRLGRNRIESAQEPADDSTTV